MMLRNELPKINGSLPGPKSKEIIEQRERIYPRGVACNTPCVIQRGEGAMFEDLDGNIFMDWVGGIGVLNIGYSHPEIIEVVKEQCDLYFHTCSSVIPSRENIRLAERLSEISTVYGNKKKTVFVNSGAEALENAVKIARKYTKRSDIVVFNGAFHGRTLLTMTMTSKVRPYKFNMGPFAPGVYRCEFPYIYRRPTGILKENALDYYIEKLHTFFNEYVDPETVAAVILEPIQGEGGFIVPPIEYVREMRNFCTNYGMLLVADEVQSGFSRSGRMFASNYWQEAGFQPDIMTTAKSLAAGLPLSAVTARAEIMDECSPGELGGTFSGNPLSCVAGLKVIDIMQRDNYPGKALHIGDVCMKRFATWKDKYQIIGDVRGIGAMMAIEFVHDRVTKEPAPDLVKEIITECAQKGLILLGAGVRGNNLRFLMPLSITNQQLDAGLNILEEAISRVNS